MKRKLLMGSIALLLLAGCSQQPNLKNAKVVNENNQTQQTKSVEANTTASEANESVNTENANVEEQTLSDVTTETNNTENNTTSIKVSAENASKDFAKNLSSIVIHFDFDKYNIKPSEWPKVQKLANLIKSNNSNYTVRIEGNCDEWGTEEYNYALGLKRANSVKNALIKLGVDPKKLTIISYGELNPVCTAHAKWCWRLNRRDNFTYLP